MQTIHKCLLALAFMLSLTTAVNAQTVREFIGKGIELFDAGHYAEALIQYEAALKLEPNNSSAHYEMASTLAALEKYDDAIDHAEKVIKLKNGNENLAYTMIGTAYDLMGKPKKAIKAYEEGIKSFPNDYNLYYNLGITQYGQKEYDKAETNFMASAKLNPKHANSHYALGSIELEKDQKIKAMLPLYAYLKLNAIGKRALSARELLEKLFLKGVNVRQKDDNNSVINISLGMPNDKSEFGSIESSMTLMASLMSIKLDKKLKDSLKINDTPEGKFYNNTETLFSLLSAKDRKVTDSFWQTNYVDMFKELFEAKHLEAFCYSIYGDTEGVKKWQKENADKVAAYKEWLKPKTNLVPMGSKTKN